MDHQEEFVRIDVAKTPFEARVVVSILQEAGIPAYVDGANLQDEYAISQAIMNNVGVRITVRADQVEAAYEAINAARATPLERSSVGSAEAHTLAVKPPVGWFGFSRFSVTVLLAAVVFFALWQAARAEARALRSDSVLLTYDTWDHGVRSYWKGTRKLCWQTVDDNRNGVPEVSTWFNRDGARLSVSYDADENGMEDRVEMYNPGSDKRIAELFDRDGDGVLEEWIQYYPDGSKSLWRDRDQDGLYEEREFFDPKGELLFTEQDRGKNGYVRR